MEWTCSLDSFSVAMMVMHSNSDDIEKMDEMKNVIDVVSRLSLAAARVPGGESDVMSRPQNSVF